jgi:hypothetical protein
MPGQLRISSSLEHDGDGVVRYRIDAKSREFRAAALAWGTDADAEKLAALLKGFPARPDARVEFGFGSPGTGTADLHFAVASPRGLCKVQAAVTSEYPAGSGPEHQSAVVIIEFFPAALDLFCQQLSRFKPNRPNEAELNGNAV